MADNPLYAELQADAAALLAEYGRPMTLRRPGASTIDPVTDEEVSSPPQDLPTTGIITGYADNLIDGTRIKSGDRKAIIDASQVPELSDRLVIGAESWTLVNIEAKQPAETALVYVLQVRR